MGIKLIHRWLVLCLITANTWAQSVHEEQNRFYNQLHLYTEADFDTYHGYSQPRPNQRAGHTHYKLQKKVIGFNPYWVGTAYNSYDYGLLSAVAYFSYEVEPKTGSYTTIRDWKTTNLIQVAQAQGTKVLLTVTNFGNTANTTLLNNPLARQTLIDSLVSLVKLRSANGVNIDFESVPVGVRDSLSRFVAELSLRLKKNIPGAQLSIDLPAVDWSNAFDVKTMLPYIDDFLIMGYDYYYAGSTKAGPVAPLNNTQLFGNLSISKSIDDYLAKGIPPDKLLLGVPYYGRTWATVSDQLAANTITSIASSSKVYSTAKKEAQQYGRRWHTETATAYYLYQNNGQWYQTWYDDAESLLAKYTLLKTKGLAGVGIWALSYDGTEPDLKLALRNAFTDDPVTAQVPTPAEVMVFPNPTQRQRGLLVRLPAPAHLSLVNMAGTVAFRQQTSQTEVFINTKALPAGVYVLQVHTETGHTNKRISLWE